MNDPDFYLNSVDYLSIDKPHACRRVKRVAYKKRDDFLVITIDPPIIAEKYGSQPFTQLAVASRHVGWSLFPISKWPLCVHVCLALTDLGHRDRIESEDFIHWIWGELYPDFETARDQVFNIPIN